jgi:hypothetical protein
MNQSQRIPRRFAIFGGLQFYAAGGFHDFSNSADTLEQAFQLAQMDHGDSDDEWWQIFDLEERRIVAQSEFQAHGASDKVPDLNK